MKDGKRAFVAGLYRQHGPGLRRYLVTRLRESAADVPDLIQEVYLRMLRIPDHDAIRSPQAYLFTVASHVLHQHKIKLAAKPDSIDFMEALAEADFFAADDAAATAEAREQLQQIQRVLAELSPKARATFVLHRHFGFTLEEIGRQLNVSRPMVKKYLARALAHCKLRVDGMK